MIELPVGPDDRLALLLDYDGTLAPIAPRPQDAVPLPGVTDILRRLTLSSRYRVAVVSGRPVAQLSRWIPAGPVLVGIHGAEWLLPGVGRRCLKLPPQARASLEAFSRRLREMLPPESGFLLEHKMVAVALHYRLAAARDAAAVLRRARELAVELLPPADWAVVEGHKVLEVRPRQADKGAAVRWLCSEWPAFTPVYFGDDATDEDAFAAVNEAGGVSVLVAKRPRPTAARYRLKDPAAVARCLARLAG